MGVWSQRTDCPALVGRENAIVGFLPVPNGSSSDHKSSYLLGGGGKQVAVEFALMLGGYVIADMHTHPNGTIPSEQDRVYVSGIDWPYHVVIADKKNTFDWYCIDKGLVGVQLVESQAEFEGITELAAGEMGLMSLGQLFITPGGELVTTKDEGRKFVTVDEDTLKVWQWGKAVRWGRYRTDCARQTKIPYNKVRLAFKKLGWD